MRQQRRRASSDRSGRASAASRAGAHPVATTRLGLGRRAIDRAGHRSLGDRAVDRAAQRRLGGRAIDRELVAVGARRRTSPARSSSATSASPAPSHDREQLRECAHVRPTPRARARAAARRLSRRRAAAHVGRPARRTARAQSIANGSALARDRPHELDRIAGEAARLAACNAVRPRARRLRPSIAAASARTPAMSSSGTACTTIASSRSPAARRRSRSPARSTARTRERTEELRRARIVA